MATGDRRRPNGRTKVDVSLPPSNKNPDRVASTEVHTDAWTGSKQAPSTFLTTQQLAEDLERWASLHNDRPIVYPESIYRWCIKWFGKLPRGRTGPGMGYRIPLPYKYVARVWYQTEDPTIRAAATAAILADQDKQKSWVVTVANLGSTHYTVHEVASRVQSLTAMARQNNRMIHVLYVGDERNPENG